MACPMGTVIVVDGQSWTVDDPTMPNMLAGIAWARTVLTGSLTLVSDLAGKIATIDITGNGRHVEVRLSGMSAPEE